MISLTKKRDEGFTIVELLIVIVVIGILAALVVTTYAGIQSKARNAKRQTDVQALQTQIEAFYASNGYYPSNTDMNSTTWRATNMKSLDAGAMTDPKGTGSTVGVLASSTVAITATVPYQYWYVPQTTAAASCESADTTCATYTLGANLEGSPITPYTKSNLD